MKYHLTFPDKPNGCWVEVHRSKELDYVPGAVMTDAAMMKIDQWVSENNLGKRMAFNMWKLKNQASLNWFILKWS
jgi:hypothetical protein